MKTLFLLLSVAFGDNISGWVVDSDLHGCNFGSERGPGYCAGTITIQGEYEGKPDYHTIAVPYAVAISRNGQKSTLPRDGWANVTYDVEYNGRYAGVKTASAVTLEDRKGGPQRLSDRRPGFDPGALNDDELGKWFSTGHLQDYTKAVQSALARGQLEAVRGRLKGDSKLARMMTIWALADFRPKELAVDVEARLADEEGYVRAEAAYYIKAIKRVESAEKMAKLLKDSYSWSRRFAAEYIGELKLTKYKAQLEALKTDKDEGVRKAVEKALAELAKP
jgi:hypothetical protein